MEARGVSISEAARILRVSNDTVRRRIRNGQLQAVKEDGQWWVAGVMQNAYAEPTQVPREIYDALLVELEARRREVQELHTLLARGQLALPPAGGTGIVRRAWRGLFGKGGQET